PGPFTVRAKAMVRQARPTTATRSGLLLGGELRGALRDQRVRRPDEHGAGGPPHVHDHLAAFAERVGHGARVADLNRPGGGGRVAVADLEVRGVAALVDRAVDDLAGQVVAAARVGVGDELRGLHRLAGGAEGRVDEGGGKQDGGAQRDPQANTALATGVHRRVVNYRSLTTSSAAPFKPEDRISDIE